MRWNTSHHGHDPRQIDLLAILALVILIASGYVYFAHHISPSPQATAFIEPSQNVRW